MKSATKKNHPLEFIKAVLLFAVLSLTALQASGDDDEAAPFGESPGANPLPDDAGLRLEIMLPPEISPASVLISPSTESNFLGIADTAVVGTFPPDTQGAVGLTNLMLMQNTEVRIQSRGGFTNSTVTLATWWGFTNTSPFDPRLIYDPYEGRWIAVAAANKLGTNSSLLVAVSAGTDPTGSWDRRKFDAESAHTRWIDFPMVGFNKSWIVVTANMYRTNTGNSNGFQFVKLWVFNKTNFYAGGASAPITIQTSTNAPKVFTLAPSVVYDNTQTNMYLLSTWGTNTLRVYALTGTVSNPGINPTTNYPATINPAWVYAPFGTSFLPQNGIYLHAGDARIGTPVVQRNGYLWCTHHIFLPYDEPCRTAVQWWQIKIGNFLPDNVGRIDDVNNVISYVYPSLAVNRFNDVLVGYSRFSTNQYVSGNYSFRDTSDSGNKLRSDIVLKAGEDIYVRIDPNDPASRNRWGDYSATVVDPADDTGLWTLQEYARPRVGGASRWGLWWGKIAPTVLSNDTFSSAMVISDCAGTNSSSLGRATRETGEPNHAGIANSPSVWYSWAAPSTGYVRFTVTNALLLGTEPGGSDTIVSVYTGAAVNSLTGVITNHGPGGANVFFNASSNTVYRVAVAGYGGRRGDFSLVWQQTNAPMIIEQPADVYILQGTNVTFSVTASGEPSPKYWFRRHGVSVTDLAEAASTNYFILSNVTTNDTGSYSILVSNSCGTATSRVAYLTVYSVNSATLINYSISSTQFSQVVTGIVGNTYIVETTTNLINWSPIETNTVVFTNKDNAITNYPYRFYRVRTQ